MRLPRLLDVVAQVLVLAVFVVSLPRTTAHAQAPSRAEEQRARMLFERGLVHSEADRLNEALQAFDGSARRVPRASTSYNRGYVLFRLGRYEEALQALDDALSLEPTATERESIAALRAQIDGTLSPDGRALPAPPETTETAEETATTPPDASEGADTHASDAGPTPTIRKRPAGPGIAPWFVLGGGGALTVAGVTMLALGVHDRNAVEHAPVGSDWAEYAAEHERAARRTGVGIALTSVGVGTAVASILWSQLAGGRNRADTPSTAVVVEADAESASVTCVGTF